MTDTTQTHGAGAGAGRAYETRPTPYISPNDLHWFNEGTHVRLFEKFGAHPGRETGEVGTRFTVWAPNARAVSVVGDFNGWNPTAFYLQPVGRAGVWSGFVAGALPGQRYKYRVESHYDGYVALKADPFGFFHEQGPGNASIIHEPTHVWGDDGWMRGRAAKLVQDAPVSIYEMHVGSWLRPNGQWPTYREIAIPLARHLTSLGYSHVEFLPVMEHPFGGSWGYQTTGYFAPSSRWGTPDDFAFLVDTLHQHGVGVIVDWVPSHFATDEHGLAYFDGTHLFEHADPRQGFHPDWGSFVFNYERHEVRAFLISSAIYWLERFHIDGLRVDAVASMLYLDYSRKHGEWVPNHYGGKENLDAVSFLRQFNHAVYTQVPGVQTFAEESTSWPMVSRPPDSGGLGFGYKWDMGWMHDTLDYLELDPLFRANHHRLVSFRALYAWSENFTLPLSHDEVVHGKGSLIGKMPGDEWQKFANLRLLFAWQYAQPGKKLLFMGGELAQWREWNHDTELDWPLSHVPRHAGVTKLVTDLNGLMRAMRALHEIDNAPDGFEWLDVNDAANSVAVLMRRPKFRGEADWHEVVIAAFNFTPVPRHGFRIGVPALGYWAEVLNTDAEFYGGSGIGNLGGKDAHPVGHYGRPYSIEATLPPLAAVFFRLQKTE
jgi:1,4-alpha-glucan branching enzyme